MNSNLSTPMTLLNGTQVNVDDVDLLEQLPVVETVFVSIVLGVVIILTVIGNTTVLLAVYLDKRLRSTTNYFIVNLAAADLLLGITVLPLSASLEVLKFWPFGSIMCDIWASTDVLLCTASIMTLCVISIDRYIGVTRPLRHSSIITKRRAGFIVALVWLLSLAISVGPLIGWRETGVSGAFECSVTKQVGYVMFSVAGSFYIPTFIIVIVYIRIYREAERHQRYLMSGTKTIKIGEDNGVILRIHTARASQPTLNYYQSSSSSDNSEGSLRKLTSRMTPAGKLAKFRREKKAAKTLGIVVGVFIVCWFPFFFCLPLDVLCSSCYVPEKLFTVIFWLGYCNSLMNPIIYASSSREFKRAFIKVLRCYWLRRKYSSRNNHTLQLDFRTYSASVNGAKSKRKSRGNGAKLTSKQNMFYCRRKSESPVKSLLIFQERNKMPSPTSPQDVSKKSSYSSLEDEEFATNIPMEQMHSKVRNYSVMV